MKKPRSDEWGGLFRDAERLAPPPGLWRRIEAQARMDQEARDQGSAAGAAGAAFWRNPVLRVAASVVLAVGFLGLGLLLKPGPKRMAASPAPAAVAEAQNAEGAEEMELVDPELLGWHADLGEIDEEAEEAEEVL
ncbi:MAG TPA: hypothetical protein VJ385_15155 [Fibrobacteria bacterium]|nr:hypothetical protein [Fibrobacteria bacterium]